VFTSEFKAKSRVVDRNSVCITNKTNTVLFLVKSTILTLIQCSSQFSLHFGPSKSVVFNLRAFIDIDKELVTRLCLCMFFYHAFGNP